MSLEIYHSKIQFTNKNLFIYILFLTLFEINKYTCFLFLNKFRKKYCHIIIISWFYRLFFLIHIRILTSIWIFESLYIYNNLEDHCRVYFICSINVRVACHRCSEYQSILWPGHVDTNHSTSQRLAVANLKPRLHYIFP